MLHALNHRVGARPVRAIYQLNNVRVVSHIDDYSFQRLKIKVYVVQCYLYSAKRGGQSEFL